MKGRAVKAERMKIGGVLVSQKIGMISIEGTPNTPGIAGMVLESLGTAGISVEFISCCPDLGGGATISVCVEMTYFDEALDRVEEIRAEVDAKKVVTNEDLCALAVFGPHFREIPNVASQVFKALAEVGINILAISTSVSSVTCVFKQESLAEALTSLRSRFEIP